MKSVLLASVMTVALASGAAALDYRTSMQNFLETSVMPWAESPEIVDAIKAQNAETASYDASRIDMMDMEWRAAVGTATSDLVNSVENNPASDFLRARVAEAGGMITEAFIMDAQGLNVALSGLTSDYWQGDEEKHSQTYAVGPDAVHYGEVSFDESSQTYQAQISFTITDPDTGMAIGAMTIGVDADALM